MRSRTRVRARWLTPFSRSVAGDVAGNVEGLVDGLARPVGVLQGVDRQQQHGAALTLALADELLPLFRTSRRTESSDRPVSGTSGAPPAVRTRRGSIQQPVANRASPAAIKSAPMQREYQRWYTGRLGRDMGVVVYGHWGTPLLAFPTSGGDEWEMEGQGMVGGAGRVHRRRADQAVHRRLERRSELLQQGRPPLPSELDAAAVGRIHPLGSDAVHPPPLQRAGADRHDGRVARARITPPTRCSNIPMRCARASRCRACTTCAGSWTASTTTTSISTTPSTTSAG